MKQISFKIKQGRNYYIFPLIGSIVFISTVLMSIYFESDYILVMIGLVIFINSILLMNKFENIFSPMSVAFSGMIISFVVKPIYIVVINKAPNTDHTYSQLIIFIFLLIYTLSLYYNSGINGSSLYKKISNREMSTKSILFGAIIIVPITLYLYFSTIGTFSFQQIIFSVLSNRYLFQNNGGLYIQEFVIISMTLIILSLYFILINDSKKSIILIGSFIILTLLTMAIFYTLGGRGIIVMPLLGFLFIWTRVKRKVSMVGFIVILTVIMSFSAFYGLMRDGESADKFEPSSIVFSFTENILNRYNQYDNLTSLINNPPNFYPGKSFVDLAYSPIPRSIMPDKAYQFNSQMTQIYRADQFSANIVTDFTLLGEMFANFGILGIVIGGFLYGRLILLFNTLYKKDSSNFFIIYYPLFILKPMSYLYGGLINSAANMLLILDGVLILIIWLLITRRKCEKKVSIHST